MNQRGPWWRRLLCRWRWHDDTPIRLEGLLVFTLVTRCRWCGAVERHELHP